MTSVAQRLRQKLLDLAIHGKLVPQNPNDEPAGELLTRIRTARSAAGRARTPAALRPIPEEEVPFDLPSGWAWCRLGDVTLLTESKVPSGEWFDYIDIDAVDNKNNVVANPKHLPVSTAPSRASRGLQSGDTLFSSVRPYLRNIAFIDERFEDCIASTGFHVCRPSEALEPRFLFYVMLSSFVVDGINAHMKGDNSPSVNDKDIVSYPIPLPPLAEQKRIVEKLDGMLNEATRIAEGTERLALLRKKAKAKILDLAIRGKLVKQEKSDEPVSELLKRIAAERAKLVAEKKIKKEKPLPPIAEDEIPFDLPKGWAWCRLRDVVSEGPRNGYSPAPVDYDTGVRKLILSATTRGVFDGSAYKFIDAKIPSDSYLWLRKGDLLIQRSNSLEYLGISCIYNGSDKAFVYPDLMMKVRANDAVLLEYLDFALKSATTHKYYVDHATGTAGNMPKINGEVVSMTPIPLPPLAEQRRIVAKVKEMLAACDALGGEG